MNIFEWKKSSRIKDKLKYDNSRFLKNDRKDNEIIILRTENSNLKQAIKKIRVI